MNVPHFFGDYVQRLHAGLLTDMKADGGVLGKNDCRCQQSVVCRGFDIGYLSGWPRTRALKIV